MRRREVDRLIRKSQETETEGLYLELNGTPCVNLITVADVVQLPHLIPVGFLIKSNGEPRKPGTQPGRWAYVREGPNWIGTAPLSGTREQLDDDFRVSVVRATTETAQSRRTRLCNASKRPEKVAVVALHYRRNPDVVAVVLVRANGTCERCGRTAPFRKRTDNSPYLEVHHKQQLAAGGEDTVQNGIAPCPTCHRELHFGSPTGA